MSEECYLKQELLRQPAEVVDPKDPIIIHVLENLRDEMREVRLLALAGRAEAPGTYPRPEYDSICSPVRLSRFE
jgi:hypothetical protein